MTDSQYSHLESYSHLSSSESCSDSNGNGLTIAHYSDINRDF